MSNTILCNLSDANSIIEEERLYWIFELLDFLGVPDETYDAESMDEFRLLMAEYGLEVEMKTNGDVDVYKLPWHEGETEEKSGWLSPAPEYLVGHWNNNPNRIKVSEGINVYYRIELDEWSVISAK